MVTVPNRLRICQLTRRFDDFAVSVFFYPLSLSLSLSSASFCGQSRRLVAEDMKTMLWNESTRLAYSCAAGCDLSRGSRAKKKQKKGNRSRTHNVIETTDIELNLSNIAIGSEIWNELRPHRKQKLKKGCNMKVRKRMSGGGKGEETGGLLSGECRWKTLLCCCCCSACHSISIRVHHGECFYCGYFFPPFPPCDANDPHQRWSGQKGQSLTWLIKHSFLENLIEL